MSPSVRASVALEVNILILGLLLIGLFWCPTRWPRRPESRPLAEVEQVKLRRPRGKHSRPQVTLHEKGSYGTVGSLARTWRERANANRW